MWLSLKFIGWFLTSFKNLRKSLPSPSLQIGVEKKSPTWPVLLSNTQMWNYELKTLAQNLPTSLLGISMGNISSHHLHRFSPAFRSQSDRQRDWKRSFGGRKSKLRSKWRKRKLCSRAMQRTKILSFESKGRMKKRSPWVPMPLWERAQENVQSANSCQVWPQT